MQLANLGIKEMAKNAESHNGSGGGSASQGGLVKNQKVFVGTKRTPKVIDKIVDGRYRMKGDAPGHDYHPRDIHLTKD